MRAVFGVGGAGGGVAVTFSVLYKYIFYTEVEVVCVHTINCTQLYLDVLPTRFIIFCEAKLTKC